MIIKLDPIDIGRNYTVNFRLRDHLTKQPFELDSGDTLQIAFKQSAKSSSYLLSAALSPGDTAGDFYVSFSDSETSTLPEGRIYWDLSLLHDGDCFPVVPMQSVDVQESIYKRSAL